MADLVEMLRTTAAWPKLRCLQPGILMKQAADEIMLNSARIQCLKLGLAEIADPTLTADECRSIARELLGWNESATADKEQGA